MRSVYYSWMQPTASPAAHTEIVFIGYDMDRTAWHIRRTRCTAPNARKPRTGGNGKSRAPFQEPVGKISVISNQQVLSTLQVARSNVWQDILCMPAGQQDSRFSCSPLALCVLTCSIGQRPECNIAVPPRHQINCQSHLDATWRQYIILTQWIMSHDVDHLDLRFSKSWDIPADVGRQRQSFPSPFSRSLPIRNFILLNPPFNIFHGQAIWLLT
jgi:hypothetical protein